MSDSSNVRLQRGEIVRVRGFWTALLLCALVPGIAIAGDECKEIQLDGVGGVSGSTVTIRVVDSSPAVVDPQDIISKSCDIAIEPNEPAADLIRRLPGFWGDGLGAACGRTCSVGQPNTTVCFSNSGCDSMAGLGDGVCGDQPKKQCGNVQLPEGSPGRSCTIEARVTQVKGKCLGGIEQGASCTKDYQCPGSSCPGSHTLATCTDALRAAGNTCTKKRTLRVCCKPTTNCDGGKLAGADIPITVQTMINPGTDDCAASTWCPVAVPGDNTTALRIKSDPIDGRPGPTRGQRDCRVALQSASGVLTQSVFDVLRECHRKVMSGQLPNGSCAALNPADVAPATQALQLAITNSCASTGHSPSAFGYRACPPPCESIPEGPLAVCSAGLVGSCQRDRDCDTAVDAGDGVCGDWSTMNACTACQAKAAGLAAIEAAYGEVADEQALPGAAENCQNTIGNSIATVLAAELKDVARCQKSIDEFKLLLPNDTPKCKDADPKSKRARARESVVPDLMTNCNTPAALAPLDTCATNPPGLRNCLPRIVRRLVAEVSDAAAPEGMCGDGKRGFHETCDDSNAIDGDGCDSNCTLTACGNGIITSGEECDDGNTVDGDGCSSGCQSEPQPCAPQTCSNFSFDCSALFPGDCVCLGAAEGGGGSCVNNFNCATAQPCNTSLECPPGETCYRDTCCAPPGAGVCGPQKCKAQ